jgi:hypothetical protein
VALFEGDGRSPVAVQTLDLAQVDGVEDVEGHIVVRARNTGNSPFPQDFTFYRSGGRWTAQPAGHLQNTVIDLILAIGPAAPSVARQMIDVKNRTWGGVILLPGEGACCASGGVASGTLRWAGEVLVPERVVFSRIGRPALRYDYTNGRWSEVPLGDEWTLERHIAACWRGRSPLSYVPWLGLRASAAPDGRVTSLTLDADEQAPNRSPNTSAEQINAERAALLEFARSTVQRCPVPRERVSCVNSRVHRVRFYGPWTR